MNETIKYHIEDEDIIEHEKKMITDGWEPLDARECNPPTESCVTYLWTRQAESDE